MSEPSDPTSELDDARQSLSNAWALIRKWEHDRDICLAWINDPAMHVDEDHPRRLSDTAEKLDRCASELTAALHPGGAPDPRLARARRWIETCVDPTAVGPNLKQAMLNYLDGKCDLPDDITLTLAPQ